MWEGTQSEHEIQEDLSAQQLQGEGWVAFLEAEPREAAMAAEPKEAVTEAEPQKAAMEALDFSPGPGQAGRSTRHADIGPPAEVGVQQTCGLPGHQGCMEDSTADSHADGHTGIGNVHLASHLPGADATRHAAFQRPPNISSVSDAPYEDYISDGITKAEPEAAPLTGDQSTVAEIQDSHHGEAPMSHPVTTEPAALPQWLLTNLVATEAPRSAACDGSTSASGTDKPLILEVPAENTCTQFSIFWQHMSETAFRNGQSSGSLPADGALTGDLSSHQEVSDWGWFPEASMPGASSANGAQTDDQSSQQDVPRQETLPEAATPEANLADGVHTGDHPSQQDAFGQGSLPQATVPEANSTDGALTRDHFTCQAATNLCLEDLRGEVSSQQGMRSSSEALTGDQSSQQDTRACVGLPDLAGSDTAPGNLVIADAPGNESFNDCSLMLLEGAAPGNQSFNDCSLELSEGTHVTPHRRSRSGSRLEMGILTTSDTCSNSPVCSPVCSPRTQWEDAPMVVHMAQHDHVPSGKTPDSGQIMPSMRSRSRSRSPSPGCSPRAWGKEVMPPPERADSWADAVMDQLRDAVASRHELPHPKSDPFSHHETNQDASVTHAERTDTRQNAGVLCSSSQSPVSLTEGLAHAKVSQHEVQSASSVNLGSFETITGTVPQHAHDVLAASELNLGTSECSVDAQHSQESVHLTGDAMHQALSQQHEAQPAGLDTPQQNEGSDWSMRGVQHSPSSANSAQEVAAWPEYCQQHSAQPAEDPPLADNAAPVFPELPLPDAFRDTEGEEPYPYASAAEAEISARPCFGGAPFATSVIQRDAGQGATLKLHDAAAAEASIAMPPCTSDASASAPSDIIQKAAGQDAALTLHDAPAAEAGISISQCISMASVPSGLYQRDSADIFTAGPLHDIEIASTTEVHNLPGPSTAGIEAASAAAGQFEPAGMHQQQQLPQQLQLLQQLPQQQGMVPQSSAQNHPAAMRSQYDRRPVHPDIMDKQPAPVLDHTARMVAARDLVSSEELDNTPQVHKQPNAVLNRTVRVHATEAMACVSVGEEIAAMPTPEGFTPSQSLAEQGQERLVPVPGDPSLEQHETCDSGELRLVNHP